MSPKSLKNNRDIQVHVWLFSVSVRMSLTSNVRHVPTCSFKELVLHPTDALFVNPANGECVELAPQEQGQGQQDGHEWQLYKGRSGAAQRRRDKCQRAGPRTLKASSLDTNKTKTFPRGDVADSIPQKTPRSSTQLCHWREAYQRTAERMSILS